MKKNMTFAYLSVFIWATMATVVKMVLANIPNLQALCISSIFSVLFLVLINLKSQTAVKWRQYTAKDYGIMAGLGFIGLFLYSAFYFYGLSILSSQEACILNYLWPMMLVVFSAVILHEKLTPRKIIAMVCSFAGIIILSSGGSASGSTNALFGILCCILAAACYGLFSVWNKKTGYDQTIAMTIMWLVTAVCSFILGITTEEWVPITATQWPGILWLGIAINAIAYLLWALALQDASNTAKIANLAYLTPFLSLLISAVVLKEQIQPRALIAFLFIIGGILLQALPFGAKQKESIS